MEYLLFSIKQQVSVLSLLLLLALVGVWGSYRGKRKLRTASFSLFALLFFLFSTSFFPRYLARGIEVGNSPFQIDSFRPSRSRTVIHVLGAGYNADTRLPATGKLALASLGRLTEGIRIQKMIPGSLLMCSGNGLMVGVSSQAETTRLAALQLGSDSVNTAALKTPATTLEEARDLAKVLGTDINLILVTDALHMPRAVRFFSSYGFRPIPAPTNFRVPQGGRESLFKWMPKLENLELSDLVLHEYLGYLKNYLMPS
jgi:uncharacterized SAM-binding protein YcdF (DUF218 family)